MTSYGGVLVPTACLVLVHYQADRSLVEFIVVDKDGTTRHLDENENVKMVQVGKLGVMNFEEYNEISQEWKIDWLSKEAQNCIKFTTLSGSKTAWIYSRFTRRT